MAIRIKKSGISEVDRLMRKGDQESELGSLAASDGDGTAAAKHFKKAREYWQQAKELRDTYEKLT